MKTLSSYRSVDNIPSSKIRETATSAGTSSAQGDATQQADFADRMQTEGVYRKDQQLAFAGIFGGAYLSLPGVESHEILRPPPPESRSGGEFVWDGKEWVFLAFPSEAKQGVLPGADFRRKGHGPTVPWPELDSQLEGVAMRKGRSGIWRDDLTAHEIMSDVKAQTLRSWELGGLVEPEWLVAGDHGLKAGELRLICAIVACYVRGSGGLYDCQSTVATKFGVSERTLRNWLYGVKGYRRKDGTSPLGLVDRLWLEVIETSAPGTEGRPSDRSWLIIRPGPLLCRVLYAWMVSKGEIKPNRKSEFSRKVACDLMRIIKRFQYDDEAQAVGKAWESRQEHRHAANVRKYGEKKAEAIVSEALDRIALCERLDDERHTTREEEALESDHHVAACFGEPDKDRIAREARIARAKAQVAYRAGSRAERDRERRSRAEARRADRVREEFELSQRIAARKAEDQRMEEERRELEARAFRIREDCEKLLRSEGAKSVIEGDTHDIRSTKRKILPRTPNRPVVNSTKTSFRSPFPLSLNKSLRTKEPVTRKEELPLNFMTTNDLGQKTAPPHSHGDRALALRPDPPKPDLLRKFKMLFDRYQKRISEKMVTQLQILVEKGDLVLAMMSLEFVIVGIP